MSRRRHFVLGRTAAAAARLAFSRLSPLSLAALPLDRGALSRSCSRTATDAILFLSMSGLDPTEAQLAAVSLGIEEGIHGKNSTENSYKSKEDSYIADEKRAESPLSDDDDNNGGLGPTPTEEEKQTLPHMPGPINFAAFLIAFIELAERFSYYGSTIVCT